MSFAELLRRLRAEARMTQEDLAEVAGLSSRAVSDLERGVNRTARRATASLLADALGLAGAARAEFERAARGDGFNAAGREGDGLAAATTPRDAGSFAERSLDRPERDLWLLDPRINTYVIIGSNSRLHALPGKDSDYSEINYIGDRDSVLEASVHIARLFPSAQIHRYAASRLPDTARKSALVVIGGPLDNRIAHELAAYYELPLRYDLSGVPCMSWEDVSIPTKYDGNGQIASDAAVVARLPNPWNSNISLLMFQGTHTYGVLGALRALSDTVVAEPNGSLVRNVTTQTMHFAAAFAVRVSDGVIIPPLLQRSDIKLIL